MNARGTKSASIATQPGGVLKLPDALNWLIAYEESTDFA
jgi:hypothetical protein